MVDLAPASERDAQFAWTLYEESMKPLGVAIGSWSEAEERRVVLSSFEAAEAQLIVRAGQRVGWMHCRTTPQSLELWQLFVAAPHRRRGVGSTILRRLQVRARQLGLPILLAVLRNNPARHLYVREGFETHAEGPHHLFLWWSSGLR